MTSEFGDITRIRELALDAVPQGVIISDSHDDDNIIYANPAFARMTGYSNRETLGRNCRFLSGPDTDPETRARIRDCVANGKPFHGLILNYRKDGTPFWNELTITHVRDGDQHYCVGVQYDATERLALERTLRESQKMEALGKLSGGIAHDFNNILALVMGNAELIADEPGIAPQIGEAAGDIIDAATAGSQLVVRMLQFARGETSEVEMIDANTVVNETIAMLARTIGQQFALERDLTQGLGPIRVDRTLLETALINLAVNARDAMPDGGRITFRTRRRTHLAPGLAATVCVSVSDTGTGMSDAVRARAFEPFFTTKEVGHGSGLGLSMVYGFVSQSGGEARISSAVGEGTTVEMFFPECSPVPNESEEDGKACSGRLLLVEDDSKLRKVLVRHLRGAGFDVDDAGSANEALDLIAGKDGYDHLVSDIRLPGGLSGVDLVKQLRQRDRDTRVVLMTGYSSELARVDPEALDIKVLRKPFPVKALLEAVSSAD